MIMLTTILMAKVNEVIIAKTKKMIRRRIILMHNIHITLMIASKNARKISSIKRWRRPSLELPRLLGMMIYRLPRTGVLIRYSNRLEPSCTWGNFLFSFSKPDVMWKENHEDLHQVKLLHAIHVLLILCTYWLSGKARRENIWLEVRTYGPSAARSVLPDRGQIFSSLVRPNSVNKHFIIWPCVFEFFWQSEPASISTLF